MKDDGLNDTQQSKITYNYTTEFPIPTYHCECGNVQEGFSVCLKCNPQTYRIVGIEKALETNVYKIEIWNKAIEAAAIELETSYQGHTAINAYCACVRSLKK